MAKTEWEEMVPDKGTTTDYISDKKQEEKETPDVDLRGKVEYKKKGFLARATSDFKRHFPAILFGVAIPEMGKILFNNIVETMYSSIFGGSYSGSGKRSGRGYYFNDSRVVEYDKRNGRDKDSRNYDISKNKTSYDEFLFTNRLDVEDILGILVSQARDDGKVSVADLYSIVRRTLKKRRYPTEIIEMLESPQFTDRNYGWYYDDLRTARVGVYGRDRYFLDLPDEVVIK